MRLGSWNRSCSTLSKRQESRWERKVATWRIAGLLNLYDSISTWGALQGLRWKCLCWEREGKTKRVGSAALCFMYLSLPCRSVSSSPAAGSSWKEQQLSFTFSTQWSCIFSVKLPALLQCSRCIKFCRMGLGTGCSGIQVRKDSSHWAIPFAAWTLQSCQTESSITR